MPKIARSIEIQANKDIVWKIISDLGNEPDYWYGTKEVRIISKNDLTVEREITQNFRNHKIMQKIVLHPSDFMEIDYLKGLTEGKKTLTIEQTSENSVVLRVFWDIHFSGLFWFATPFITRHTTNGTEHALERIKSAAEAISQEARA
jgi:hypothetical protein